jgi:hypothetical protein
MESRALTIADLAVMDGRPEPVVKDLKLAEALGMKLNRLRSIRTPIKKNIEEIETHGTALRCEALFTKGNGAKERTTEYWLTEAQALAVCALSCAPKAKAVRAARLEQIITGFGQLAE